MAMYFLETAPTLHYSTHAVPHRVITPTQLPQHPTANTPCDLFSQVHYVLQHNLLRTCWHSQDSQNQFMASLELGQYTHASLEATFRPEIARSWTNINSDSNYIEALGRHSAVKFGPGRITSVYFCQKETLETCDTTLSLSAVLSHLSSLTKCIHLVAIPHLAEYAENRSPGPRQDTLA